MSVRPAWFYSKPIALTAADRPPAQCVDVGRPLPQPVTLRMMVRCLLRLIDREHRDMVFPAAVTIHFPSKHGLLSMYDFADLYLRPAARAIEAHVIPAQAPGPDWDDVAYCGFGSLSASVRCRRDVCDDLHHVRFDVRRSKEIVAHDAAAVARDIAVLEEMYDLEPTE
jgi:hypothetical protein